MNQRTERQGLVTSPPPTDDPRHALILSTYAPEIVGTTTAFVVLGTVVVLVVAWLSGSEMLTVGASAIAFTLALLQVPLMSATAASLRRGDWRAFEALYIAGAQVQYSWVLWLGLMGGVYTHGLIALALCIWIFHDADLVEAPLMKWAYMLMFPVFDLLVLGVVLIGGGRVVPWNLELSTVGAVLAVQVMVAALVYNLIEVLTSQAREREALERAHEGAVRRLDRVQTERSLLFNMSQLLGRGLALSRFWHDARNAVQSVVLDGPYLRSTFEPHLATLVEDDEERDDIAHALLNVDENARLLAKMLRDVRRTLGGSEDLQPLSPEAIVEEVLGYAARDLRLRGEEMPDVDRQIDDAVHLWVAESQLRAVANVVINGAVRTRDGSMAIRGEAVSPELYAFEITDRGVDGEERELALRRVRARLELADDHDDEARGRDNVGDGFGMGLMFAKVQVVGRGGEISARANEDGPGLTFRVVIRRPFGAPEEAG